MGVNWLEGKKGSNGSDEGRACVAPSIANRAVGKARRAIVPVQMRGVKTQVS
jgi:hypothetical protein